MLCTIEIGTLQHMPARQRNAFAPLKMSFGAKGTGKSTSFQSPLDLHELLERGSATSTAPNLAEHAGSLNT